MMTNRTVRLGKALWLESIKRIPYVILVLLSILIVQSYVNGARTVEGVQIARKNTDNSQQLLQKMFSLSEDNNRLSQEIKSLSEQNNRLADQSNRYQDCIAQIFAKYTRDNRPVYITDLNSCAVKNSINGASRTQSGISSQSSSSTPTQTQDSTPSSSLPPSAAQPAQQNGLDKLLALPQSILQKLLRR